MYFLLRYTRPYEVIVSRVLEREYLRPRLVAKAAACTLCATWLDQELSAKCNRRPCDLFRSNGRLQFGRPLPLRGLSLTAWITFGFHRTFCVPARTRWKDVCASMSLVCSSLLATHAYTSIISHSLCGGELLRWLPAAYATRPLFLHGILHLPRVFAAVDRPRKPPQVPDDLPTQTSRQTKSPDSRRSNGVLLTTTCDSKL